MAGVLCEHGGCCPTINRNNQLRPQAGAQRWSGRPWSLNQSQSTEPGSIGAMMDEEFEGAPRELLVPASGILADIVAASSVGDDDCLTQQPRH